MLKDKYWRCLAAFSASLASTTALSQTVIVADGTLGLATDLSNSDATIPAELGQTRGGNLFHSFDRFDIGTGERATFAGPASIENVISRVTGGRFSLIDGTLASTVGNADVWLINPAGILFGNSARLDVPAGFHAATADHVNFADGTRFSVSDLSGSTLSVAAPEAFGFLGGGNGQLNVIGSSLQVSEGQDLTLASGDVDLFGADVTASGGQIVLATRSDAGILAIDGSTAASNLTGRIEVGDNSNIQSLGSGGGHVIISGGEIFVARNSDVFASNSSNDLSRAGITLAGDVVSIVDRSRIAANTVDTGDAGMVAVTADTLLLQRGGQISSSTFAQGSAGGVTIDAGSFTIDGDALDGIFTGAGSTAELGSTGDAGTVTVTADTLLLQRGGQISSSTFAQGSAGGVTIDAGSFTIDGDALDGILTGATSSAQPNSTGDAGTVNVRAIDLTLIDSGQITSNASTGSTGDAGVVAVTADTLLLQRGGEISSASAGSGLAGDVLVQGGQIIVREGTIATAGANNAGGRIDVSARQAIRLDQGVITTSGILPAEGTSLLTLTAPFVEILNSSRVLSLAGDGAIIPTDGARTGEAFVDGVITIVSDDSEIAASTDVIVQGLESEVGSGLQISDAVPLDGSRLLASPCVGANRVVSSFSTARVRFEDSPLDTLGHHFNANGQAVGC